MLTPTFAIRMTALRIRMRRSWHGSSRICGSVVQVGIRSIRPKRPDTQERLTYENLLGQDIVGRTDWIDSAIDRLTENVYLTIDIDGLDPSIMPTTGTPEPGGLGWYETLTLIRKLAERKRIVGMDIVEYSYVENYDSPAFLCANWRTNP